MYGFVPKLHERVVILIRRLDLSSLMNGKYIKQDMVHLQGGLYH